ncbi:MAG: glycosyltransferase, partial [Planococcus donghaensis]
QKSRGDQILNANLFEKQGFAKVVEEEELSAERFMKELLQLKSDKDQLIEAMTQAEAPITAGEMAKLVATYTK